MLKKAFTLIELLIVVVILGILSALVLMVMNPAMQRQRAAEGVLRTQMTKVCSGLVACMGGNATYNTASCNTAPAINVFGAAGTITIGQPSGATYLITVPSAGTSAANYVRITGNITGGGGYNCRMTCDVSNDLSSPNPNAGSMSGTPMNGGIYSTGCRT